MMWFAIFLGCLNIGGKSNDDSSLNSSIDQNTMDDYKAIYCEEYAMRCDVYSSVEICEQNFDSWFSEDCTIIDKETFDICVDWLMSLDCSVEGFIDDCDQFYECP